MEKMITYRSKHKITSQLMTIVFLSLICMNPLLTQGMVETPVGDTSITQSDSVITINPFTPLADSLGLPQPYHNLDSLLDIFYNQLIDVPEHPSPLKNFEQVTWNDSDFSDTYCEEIARNILWTHFYPDSLYSKYCITLNRIVGKYLQRIDRDRRAGIHRTEITYPLPGWVVNRLFKDTILPDRFGWEQYLLLQSQYILEVIPVKKRN